MDQFHKQALSNKTTVIMGRISSPTVFAAYLNRIFSASDIEQIKAKENQLGATHATQTLLSLLEKRGPKAFGIFMEALRHSDNKMWDLADELEDEVRIQQGKTGKTISMLCLTCYKSNHSNTLMSVACKLQSRDATREISLTFAQLLNLSTK